MNTGGRAGVDRRQALSAAAAAAVLPSACARGPALDARQQATLAAFAEALVPGAAAAKVGEFVLAMLDTSDRMLGYELLGAPTPARDFYRDALDALDRLSRRRFGRAVGALSGSQLAQLKDRLVAPEESAWRGPPRQIVYWVIRSDACDVVYGSETAYARLGVPYMAHIHPPSVW